MARSRDPRHPLPAERGPKRTGPIGTILPGDDLEVAREIQRLWWALQTKRSGGACDCGDECNCAYPPGVLIGRPPLDYAVTSPGGLLARYQFADTWDTSGDLLADTAGNPLGPFHATYVEDQHDNVGFTPNQLWSSDHVATRLSGAHPEFGDADDGAVRFNYDQTAIGGGYSLVSDGHFPGCGFKRVGVVAAFTSTVKSISFFFRPRSGGSDYVTQQPILASRGWNASETGTQGWGIVYNPVTSVISVGGGAFRFGSLSSPSGILKDRWHHCAVTFDSATNVYRLYLDGQQVASRVDTAGSQNTGTLTIGYDSGTYGTFNEGVGYAAYFYGDLDEIDLYTIKLSSAQVGLIWGAKGIGVDGSTTTVVDGATVGVGGAGVPGAIGSDGAADGYVLVSDGNGGTKWVSSSGGSTFRVGHGPPADVTGIDGDLYLDADSGDVYRRASGTYSVQGNLAGPTGAIGAAGPEARRRFCFRWSGTFAVTAGSDGDEIHVPYDPVDGSSFEVDVSTILLRLGEAPTGGSVQARVDRCSDRTHIFIADDILGSVTVADGDYFAQDTTLSAVVNSGDVLRIHFTDVTGLPHRYQLELLGAEPA